jgi:hypothetical protein
MTVGDGQDRNEGGEGGGEGRRGAHLERGVLDRQPLRGRRARGRMRRGGGGEGRLEGLRRRAAVLLPEAKPRAVAPRRRRARLAERRPRGRDLGQHGGPSSIQRAEQRRRQAELDLVVGGAPLRRRRERP